MTIIKNLDCTVRDGGYINNWRFNEKFINEYCNILNITNIDYVEIGFINNANLALYRFQRQFWDEHNIDDINIIHYTMSKPWKCSPNGPYGPICKLWINAE